MYDFKFYSNLSKLEQKRFNTSFSMIFNLYSTEYKNKLIEKAKKKIISVVVGFDKGIKGHIESDNDVTNVKIKYEPYSIFNKKKSYHISVHELIHALGKGNNSNEDIINKNLDKFIFSNVFMCKYENGSWISYGRIMSEVGVELLTSMCLSFNKNINYKQRILADDFIKNELEFWESGYKLFAPIGRLMTYATNNDYENTYYGLVKKHNGIIDNLISFDDCKIPVNDYLYSLMIDGFHIEKVFNYYSNNTNAWQIMCTELDNEYERATNSKDHILDQYVIKKQILKITNMFYNKLNIFLLSNIITHEEKDKIINEYNIIFNETLKSYGVIFDKYDEKMVYEALNDKIIKKPYSLN